MKNQHFTTWKMNIFYRLAGRQYASQGVVDVKIKDKIKKDQFRWFNYFTYTSKVLEFSFRLPAEKDFLKATTDDLVTFVFCRHPFSRLVSAYAQKMKVDPTFKELRHKIVNKYRPQDSQNKYLKSNKFCWHRFCS